jgi:predicted nucleotidyltransferase
VDCERGAVREQAPDLGLVYLRVLRNNLRIVRKTSALTALFPAIRGQVLAATLAQPEKWWYLSELASFLGMGPSSLQRELRDLVEGGILERRRDGRRVYFKADTRSPLFGDLRSLLEKTAGLLPTLRSALERIGGRIDCAFVYGSVARRREHAQSDIDLLVIGDIGLAALAPALRKVEGRLGREISATCYSRLEFRKKVAARDHFLTAVLDGPKEFVKGSESDLDEVTGKPRRPTSPHVEKRTR